MASRKFNRDYFEDNRIFQLDYYKEMRKKHDVLVEDGKPIGGKWSFDQENRKKMPQNIEIPEIPKFSDKNVKQATEWVKMNSHKHLGTPITFSGL